MAHRSTKEIAILLPIYIVAIILFNTIRFDLIEPNLPGSMQAPDLTPSNINFEDEDNRNITSNKRLLVFSFEYDASNGTAFKTSIIILYAYDDPQIDPPELLIDDVGPELNRKDTSELGSIEMELDMDEPIRYSGVTEFYVINTDDNSNITITSIEIKIVFAHIDNPEWTVSAYLTLLILLVPGVVLFAVVALKAMRKGGFRTNPKASINSSYWQEPTESESNDQNLWK